MAGCQEFDSIPLEETEILGAKLNKNVEDLNRTEAEIEMAEVSWL